MRKLYYLIILSLLMISNVSAQWTHAFHPQTVDPNLIEFNTDSIYAFTPNLTTAKNQLLVFLPGTGASTEKYRLFGQKAMEEGYHVILLPYHNEPTVYSMCTASEDLQCFEDTRLEIIDGMDRTTNVDVDETHSIFGRLKSTLNLINLTFPFENYEFFISGGELVLDKIAWSGHSQGGGHAAMIGQKYFSPRVICFAAPKDYSSFLDGPAPWYSNLWVTPTDNVLGFGHTLDGFVKQEEIYASMGLEEQGPLRIIENNDPPYFNTHKLYTNRPVGVLQSHGVMIYDDLVPFENGINVYDEAWSYLLNTPTITGANNLDNISLNYYPNPIQDFLYFDTNEGGIFEIKIYDIQGKLVLFKPSFDLQDKLDMRPLKEGIYILNLHQNNQLKSYKIVKQ